MPTDTTGYSYEIAWEAPYNGYVTALNPWHVPNSEAEVKVKPVIRKDGSSPDVDIPSYSDGEKFITGEPSGEFSLKTKRAINEGEKIVLKCTNENSNFAYRVRYIPTVVGGEL